MDDDVRLPVGSDERVRVRHARRELGGDVDREERRKRLSGPEELLDRRLEGDALDPLHRQVVAVVDAIEVVDLDEVRVDEARGDPRLLLEQLDVLGREEPLVDLLDRDPLAESGLAEDDRGEDLGHSSDVDSIEEVVAPEPPGKGFFHGAGRYRADGHATAARRGYSPRRWRDP